MSGFSFVDFIEAYLSDITIRFDLHIESLLDFYLLGRVI